MVKKQTVAEAVRDIRTNLQFSAEYLRRFDQSEADRVAQKLDRLRWNLKKYTEEKNAV